MAASYKSDAHSFVLLDGLRGVAAIGVAILHMPRVFSGFSVPNAGLAVDFFLQLSGFIIAYAYAGRIQRGMSFGDFTWRRVNRLFPVYILGFLLGWLVAIAALRYSGNGLTIDWTPGSLACATIPNLLMLPQVGCGTKDFLFPINPPMWSIFFEVLANFVFFIFIGYLLKVRRTLPIAMALFCVLVYETAPNKLGVGFLWPEFFAGSVRVMFSFLMGLSIFNLGLKIGFKSSTISFGLFIILGLILLVPATTYLYQILMVAIVFPTIVLIGVKVNPASQVFGWFCLQLGKTSYVLYAIHKPLYQLLYGGVVKFFPHMVGRLGISLGIGMLIIIALISWIIALFYEPVARSFMNQQWGRLFRVQSRQPGV